MLNSKNRRIAALLAFAGVIVPGLHKFYLGQMRWGVVYLLLGWTPISKIASVGEGLWYLFQDREEFDRNFNSGSLTPGAMSVSLASANSTGAALDPIQVTAVAEALRQIEQLRQEGLISEYEFEQKRRQLLDRMH